MKISRLLFLLFLFPGCCSSLFAQKTVRLDTRDSAICAAAAHTSVTKPPRCRRTLDRRLAKFCTACRQAGYLAFSVDSVAETDSCYLVHVFVGKKMTPPTVSVPHDVQLAVDEADLTHYVQNDKVQLADFEMFAQKMLRYCEENGYPFAEIYIDSATADFAHSFGIVKLEKNSRILLDTIILKGNARLRSAFLYPYLGLRKHKAYNERKLERLPQKLAELAFATVTRPPAVEFVRDRAHLYLYLDKKKSCQFDGYVGLVPVNETTGKVGLSGELSLLLRNVFAVGEELSVQWRAPAVKSQYLSVEADFPFLFRTPFGIGGDFLLDKTDTSYLSMAYDLALQYHLFENGSLKATFGYATSDMMSNELVSFADAETNFADYRKMIYGLQFHYRHLDYLFNPRKGVEVDVAAKAVSRTILKNAKVDETLYDGVDLKSTRGVLNFNIAGYIPLHRRWVLKLSSSFGGLLGKENLSNDLFKLGGLNSLRGFDEDEITATAYGIASAEVRFLFAKIAYFNLFADVACYERHLISSYLKDTPFGFGVGIAFDTKAGIFFLSYALGSQQGNPVSFKSGKIHFGLKLGF